MNWVEAAKGKAEASSPFEYAARLTEMMLLGVVALTRGHEDPLRRRRTCASRTTPRPTSS